MSEHHCSGPGPASRGWQRLAGLALLFVLLVPMPEADAADITVDVLGDPVPNGCTPGDCSLREAVSLANSLAGPDRILLPATPGVPLQLTIPGAGENANASGDLDVLDDLEIIGAGVDSTLLVQTTADRLLQTVMASDQRLLLRGLTLQGGDADSGGALRSSSLVTIEDAAFVGNVASFEGGAIAHSGGYAPSITDPRLVLRRVSFTGNLATQSEFAVGGALSISTSFDNGPYLEIEDCDFIENESRGGGAIQFSGGANIFGGGVVIRDSRFLRNVAGAAGGGALLEINSHFELVVEDSLFDGNLANPSGNATVSGGAVHLSGSFGQVSADFLRSTFIDNSAARGGALSSRGTTRVIDSHFLDNSVTLSGGAIRGLSNLTVERSTFESNQVSSSDSSHDGGGAISFSGAALDIHRSTFSGNAAYRGGVISLVSGEMSVHGSTLVAPAFGQAGRLATVLRVLDDDPTHDLVFSNSIVIGTCTFASGGRLLAQARGNIEAPGASCRFDTAVVNSENQTSATSVQVGLGALADNGGPTPTRLPGAGSIAINQGNEANCSATDQRHFARVDAECDVGAVEVGAIALPDSIFMDGFE